MDDEIRTTHNDELHGATHHDEPDIMNVSDNSDSRTPLNDAPSDDTDSTPLGEAGAMIRALAADDTDNDG